MTKKKVQRNHERAADYLTFYNILKSSKKSKAARVILSIQPDIDSYPYSSASKYVTSLWEAACAKKAFSRDVRGKGFELIIACALIRAEVFPFYWQASMQFVPLANFDLVVYTKERGPIALSLKTSTRERYKQAEFEAQALKAVHRRSRTFLLTMDIQGAKNLNSKIEEGVLTGIDEVIDCTSKALDRLFSELKQLTVIEAPMLEAVVDGRTVDRRQE